MIRLAVRVDRAQAELVLAELLELAPDGVEEVAVDERTVEYAVYGAPGELPSLPQLTGAAGGSLVRITTSETPDDWHERWKSFHRPVLIEAPPDAGGGAGQDAPAALHVRAPWQPPSTFEDALEIEIDPGQAFGTGAHATTRLCLGLLLELVASVGSQRPLLDVGTGSGVLAIAAQKLGFSPVLGVDNDPQSVTAARANALANASPIQVHRADLRGQPLPWLGRGDQQRGRLVVLANLLAPLLRSLARTTPTCPSELIAGGLLYSEADELAELFGRELGMRERRRSASGEWAALWLSGSGA